MRPCLHVFRGQLCIKLQLGGGGGGGGDTTKSGLWTDPCKSQSPASFVICDSPFIHLLRTLEIFFPYEYIGPPSLNIDQAARKAQSWWNLGEGVTL